MPVPIRSSSYITSTPGTSGSTIIFAFPAGTAINDYVMVFGVLDAIGAYTPAGWTLLSYTDQLGIAWFAYGKSMTSGDIATGSVSILLGFPAPNSVYAVVATDGPTAVREVPVYSSRFGGDVTQTVSTSSGVLATDTAVLFGGVLGNVVPTVSPGSSPGGTISTSGCSGVFATDTSLSAGVNTFTFAGSALNPTVQMAVILGTGSAMLDIDCGNPPSGVLGSPYSHLFPASGGTLPYTFAITSGSLPTGLTLNTATGSVTGTPTAVGVFPFTIRVTDAVAATASVGCSITVAPGGAWVIQEITAELIPCNQYIPGAGHFRYTVRCVDAAQAGTYLGFWESFGGGGGDITSTGGGGGDLTGGPSQPAAGNLKIAKNGAVIGSQPELNFIEGTGVTIAASNDTSNEKIDVTISASSLGGVLLEATGYTILPADAGKLISFNNASPITATLPATPPASPWLVAIENIGAGTLTVARNGNTIDAAAANLTLAQNQGVLIFSNGSAYYTERGMGGGSSITSIALTEPVEFLVSGSPITTGAGTLAVTKATQNANQVWAGPMSGAAAQPTFRALVSADLPAAPSFLTLSKYVQNFSAVTSVTINHNLGSTAVICQVYDAGGLQVLPESQTVVDANNITLTFGAAFSGSATVLGTTTRNANTVYTTSWTSQTSVTVTHNLGTTSVVVQVFDGGGLQVSPESITITSSNVVTLTFGASFTGSVVVMASPLAVVSISSYTTSWTSQTSVTVTHNLNTSNVVVQVSNGSGVEVEPESVTCTSSNVVTLTFGGSFTGSVVVIG